jgi:uncharacterized protein with ATP-grasp and redox domains
MKEIVTKSSFMDAFRDAGRRDQFTYDGLSALFDYLEEYEQDVGDEMELDVIGICCDFSEYGSVEECAEEHGLESDEEDEDDKRKDFLEQLQDNTSVIELDNGGIIIQAY